MGHYPTKIKEKKALLPNEKRISSSYLSPSIMHTRLGNIRIFRVFSKISPCAGFPSILVVVLDQRMKALSLVQFANSSS